MGISTPDGGKAKLAFVLEHIRLEKNGGKHVCTDLLIHNVGEAEIGRFRFELPCRLVTEIVQNSEQEKKIEDTYTRQCREQCAKIRVSNKLATGGSEQNWIYRALPQLSIPEYSPKKSEVSIDVSGVAGTTESLVGYVKQDWKVAISKEVGDDPHRWFVLFSNGITVVDYVSFGKTPLKPNEKMWISVEFFVPPGGMLHVEKPPPWYKQKFSRQWEFSFSIMSPLVFSDWRTSQLVNFAKYITSADSMTAVSHLIDNLTSTHYAEVDDWRIFLCWPRAFSIERVDAIEEVVEPPGGVLPPIMTGGFIKKNLVPTEGCRGQYWFGIKHGADEKKIAIRLKFDGFVISWIYNYLFPWLGVIGFLWTCFCIARLIFGIPAK